FLLLGSARTPPCAKRLGAQVGPDPGAAQASDRAALRSAGHVRRYCEPAAVPARPDVGVAALALLAGGGAVARAGVDERDVAEDADPDILDVEAADGDGACGLLQELAAVDQGAVGIGA